jgi:DNA-binding transcriptional MerR regulator
MAEYRISKLAAVSGVTERNIRAYRERGLLDPPYRRGRDAFYDDHHLAQLQTINQLLARGFTSAHIAAFLDGVRRGDTLTDVLGIRPDVVEQPVTIETLSAAAQRLVRHGLAQVVNGKVTITDPAVARAVKSADDPEYYLRLVAEVLDSTRPLIDSVAAQAAAALQAGAHFRPGVRAAGDLAKHVVGGRLRAALEEHLATPEVASLEAGGF